MFSLAIGSGKLPKDMLKHPICITEKREDLRQIRSLMHEYIDTMIDVYAPDQKTIEEGTDILNDI